MCYDPAMTFMQIAGIFLASCGFTIGLLIGTSDKRNDSGSSQ